MLQAEPETFSPAATSVIVSPPASLTNTAQADIQALLTGQLSSETRRAYRGDLKHFLTFIQHPAETLDSMPMLTKVLATVDRNTAAAYRDHMMTVEKRAAATVNRRLATITVVYNALCEEGIIAKNPFSWVKRPKVGNVGKTPAFTKEQAERIIAEPDSTPMGKRDRVLLLLLFFCGLRRGEVVRVEKDDFYESQGHIMLRVHGKGRSDKTDSVMIPRRIWPEIQAYLENVDGLLFTAQSRNTRYNRADTPISPTRIYFLFKKYCRSAGIDADSFSPHAARATFVTLCLAGGADIRSVMYATRHADPTTTIRYDRQRLNLENHASNHLHIDLPGDPVQVQYKTERTIPSPV